MEGEPGKRANWRARVRALLIWPALSTANRAGEHSHMESTIAIRERPSTAARVGRLFVKRLHGRSTLIIVLLVALVMGVTLATIRNGVTLGGITGSESTDDAYVRADQITISSHIAGYVESVPVRDNETVKQGQLVATIQDDDYRARVANAEAALEAARSAVDVLSGQAIVQTHKIAGASADVHAAEAVLKQAQLQHARQRELIDDGTTSQRELESAEADEDRLSASRDQKIAELDTARQLLQVIRTQALEAQQAVKTKAAELELARIDLGYTRIVSPSSGQLSERASLSGEYVTAGTKIGLVVPLPNVWVVANFRESQMAHMYPGQSAVVTVDSVPGIRFHGTVDSFEPASGALQALLPPDNATGNFTKVAQRFAVKVILVPGQAGINRLRPGMSAIATVAVGGIPQERK
jgi:membrane fusion protein, multidrug efflux system